MPGDAPVNGPIEIPTVQIPGLVIIELILRIVLEAMEGQTPAQKEQIWNWWLEDQKRWRKFLHLAPPPDENSH